MFNWFRKKPTNGQWHHLHGYDLREWNYLGVTEIHYMFPDNPEKYSAHVFFFMKKDDDNVRRYVVRHHHGVGWSFEDHNWITVNADKWRVCESSWYNSVTTAPSNYTKARMKKEFDYVWDTERLRWIAAFQAKTPKKNKKIVESENVVKVDFNAKNNEDA